MKRILIVEDDEGIRLSMKMVLETEYDVVTAENGVDAIEKIKAMQAPPDLVFLDLMMPIMNGEGFLEAIKKQGLIQDVPVVVVTAGTKEKLPHWREVLTKPFEIVELEKIAAKYCEQRKLE